MRVRYQNPIDEIGRVVMAIANFSTTVDAYKTAGEVQGMLASAGASRIATSYRDGMIVSLSFQIETEFGPRGFELPIRTEGVLEAMTRDKSVPRSKCTEEQAGRVAWRIAKDWLRAQIALIEAGLASLDEVMMPYMLDGSDRPMFLAYRTQQLALEAAQ